MAPKRSQRASADAKADGDALAPKCQAKTKSKGRKARSKAGAQSCGIVAALHAGSKRGAEQNAPAEREAAAEESSANQCRPSPSTAGQQQLNGPHLIEAPSLTPEDLPSQILYAMAAEALRKVPAKWSDTLQARTAGLPTQFTVSSGCSGSEVLTCERKAAS